MVKHRESKQIKTKRTDYFNEDYFSRKNIFETLSKGGYIDSGVPLGEVLWKWNFIQEKTNIKKGKILDVGCGKGEFLDIIPKEFQRFGVDVSNFAVKEANKKSGLIIKKADVENNIPFREKFDIIVAFDTLEHIEKLDAALETISSSLSKSGLLFVQVPIKTTFHLFISKLKLGILDNDPTHCQKHGFAKWNKILEKHFSVIYSKKVLYKQYTMPCLNISAVFILAPRNGKGF